jgi:hypothetical protein
VVHSFCSNFWIHTNWQMIVFHVEDNFIVNRNPFFMLRFGSCRLVDSTVGPKISTPT